MPASDSIHCLLLGTFDLAQVLVSVTDRLPECRSLTIATLCYNRRNAAEFLGLLERRPSIRFTLLVSSFFVSHNKELHEWFAKELREHHQAHMGAGRSHAKIACWQLGDGDGMVCESSANLRSNRNRETATFIRDCGLGDWHEEWISALVNKDGRDKQG